MDLLCPRRVDPVHQSPRTRMYGYFTHGTVPPSRPYSSGFLSLPNRLRRLPSPIQFDCRWLGHVAFAALQVLHRRPSTDRASLTPSLSLIGSFAPVSPETLSVLLRSRVVLPYRAVRKYLGTVGE